MIDYDKLKQIIETNKWLKNILTDLIAEFCKDEELTQPEPKYKDCWYVGVGGHPKCTKVLNQAGYAISDETDKEAFGLHVTCYPTKAALIESQITYWQNLLAEEYEQHISPYCEPEYCNVSGAKLGRREPTEGTTGCQHESKYKIGELVERSEQSRLVELKCIKCGGFYR